MNRARALLASVCLLPVVACLPQSTDLRTEPPEPEPSTTATPGPEDPGELTNAERERAPLPAASAQRAAPWPERPVVSLSFEVAEDLSSVAGQETVRFTADLPTCELVFRLWPNKPESVESGSQMVVTAAQVAGSPVVPVVEAAGAPTGAPGTLVRLPLATCLQPGDSVDAALGFEVRLGEGSGERVGHSDEQAWFATAFPLLAWERGRGWATDPAVDLFGETVVSETFRLERLDVDVPAGVEVVGTGTELGRAPSPRPGREVVSYTANAIRDVAVTAGQMDVVERDVDGLRVVIGGPASGTQAPLEDWMDEHERALRELSSYFGAYPYESLQISVVPENDSGVEFPGAIQYTDTYDLEVRQLLVSHEVAHMWFYGLVGNNQAAHPWLDESFAEYAQVLVDEQVSELDPEPIPPEVVAEVGQPMSWYAERGAFAYSAGVYLQGGIMLHEARQAVGTERFDELLLAYVDANAYQVVTPDTLAAALATEPEALEVLRGYGALP